MSLFCIVGGPGSRKGRIVDDLVNSYDFQFICGEDLIIQELPKKVSNIVKLETIKEIKSFVEVSIAEFKIRDFMAHSQKQT